VLKRNLGFTLLELVVTVAVAAILLTVAIPSFKTSLTQNQGVTDANIVLTMLDVARSEAIKHNQTVTICPSISGTSCDSAGAPWAEGYWMSYIPTGGTATTLKTEVPLSKGSTITASASFANSISFNGLGNASVSTGSVSGCFTVTPNNATTVTPSPTRYVIAYRTGRLYIAKSIPAGVTCS